MNTHDVNPFLWYGVRELDIVPKHFIKCPTNVSTDSKYWVQNSSSGRYAFASKPLTSLGDLGFLSDEVYFESMQDVIMYELLWSGT